MHHLRKDQYPSAPQRSHNKHQARSTVPPRNNDLAIRKVFVPLVRPQPLPVGSPPPFRFLDLPGEVRDLVYSFCLPAAEHKYYDGFIFTRKMKSNSAKGLMAVCQLIRHEFRPLYWSVNGPMIKSYEIPQLMDLFFPEGATDFVCRARVTILLRQYGADCHFRTTALHRTSSLI